MRSTGTWHDHCSTRSGAPTFDAPGTRNPTVLGVTSTVHYNDDA
ncbi:hypothetical protein [Glycomyces sp. L485]|nr:hypothetical protein [Glycomyces sp. L485]